MDLKLSDIDSIKGDNVELVKKMNGIKKILSEYEEQYQNNIEKIQLLCSHDFDKYIVYGERPSYQCNLCHMYA